MKRISLIFAVLMYTGCYRTVSHDTPAGQPPLAKLAVAAFEQQFNAAPGVRLVALLSPT
jgi:hypothetical protein